MCSYCGCRSISVIGRFSVEHDDIINATGLLVRAAGGGDQAAAAQAAAALVELLDPHTGSEERSLFAELRLDPEFTEHIDSLCAEHTDLHRLLDAIAGGDLELAKAFQDLIRRHIDREENGLFPAAAIALDGLAWDRVVERA